MKERNQTSIQLSVTQRTIVSHETGKQMRLQGVHAPFPSRSKCGCLPIGLAVRCHVRAMDNLATV